ncbi:MAG TPA: CBS domain-containing protein [Cyclobacteriaceae bacterium]|nr:CBS domain-containing protein [Cyclobacteriaceae bacterium]HRJ81719.1 CBS domain-containing protein [Cyclobacteriaceae bacterium]
MGEQRISIAEHSEERKAFLKHLLHDVQALDIMIEHGLLETGASRIGAEQEFFIVDKHHKPSRNGPEILAQLNDPHFTTELARYNLEINLDPTLLGGKCFSETELELRTLLRKADAIANTFDDTIILTGILPSIDLRAVEIDYLTPNPRYHALGEIVKRLRGQDFELNINGVDELLLAHTNILFEACNTSFQAHLQVEAEEFVAAYNWAQAISGPVLAIATNSPMLFGRELWAETRITLFQQSVDMRKRQHHLRERQQRVSFGNRWIKSITEVYKDDISRYPLIFMADIKKDSWDELNQGRLPDLKALRIHNGTIWKWNRPCYGILNSKAHLRIENRYLPSGPTVLDEIANMAFWVGLMKGMPDNYKHLWNLMDFEDAKENFYKAARFGIQTGMIWDKSFFPVQKLILEILLPLARKGLRTSGVDSEDIDKYLAIIEERTHSGKTGSRWMVNGFRTLKKEMGRDEAMVALTATMHNRRLTGNPVHTWAGVSPADLHLANIQYDIVGNIMTTDLITAQSSDPLELVLTIMNWRNIRHMPVEDEQGVVTGILTKRRIENYLSAPGSNQEATAQNIMITDPICIDASCSILYAMDIMIQKKISCLPVIHNQQLVGLITDYDMTKVQEKLKSPIPRED